MRETGRDTRRRPASAIYSRRCGGGHAVTCWRRMDRRTQNQTLSHASSTALRQPWWVPFRRTARSPSPRPNRRTRINRILINIHPHISQTSVLALRREIAAPANQTFHMHCALRIRYVPAQGSTLPNVLLRSGLPQQTHHHGLLASQPNSLGSRALS